MGDYKLIVIDDEPWIREGIRDMADWNYMGITHVFEAKDGEEGLAMIEAYKPDIIITDIRMPCISGLDIMQNVKSKNDLAKVIIISGYDDFQYAQKAVELGAVCYILKPLEEHKIVEAVQKCIDQMEKENKRLFDERTLRKQVEESLPLLKERFLNGLLSDDEKDEKIIIKRMSFLGIELYDCCLKVFVIEIDKIADILHNDPEWDTELLKFSILNIMSDLLGRLGKSVAFNGSNDTIVSIVSIESDGAALLDRRVRILSKALIRMVRRFCEASLTVGIGKTYQGFGMISRSYCEAVEACRFKAFAGRGRVIDAEEIINRKASIQPFGIKELSELDFSIRSSNTENILPILDSIFGKVRESELSFEHIRVFYMDMTFTCAKSIYKSTGNESLMTKTLDIYEKSKYCETIDDLMNSFKKGIMELMEEFNKLRHKEKRKIIKEIVQYIDENYHLDLSLNLIAERFFLNASYLSNLFKEEMGETFTNYLMYVRIEKSKQFLKDVKLKIYQVAAIVGYEDEKYFARVFKRITGTTPIQYREHAN